MKIGTKIRELRQQAGISQEILARALSMTPQAVSRWENGTTAPDISLLPALANYFGVSIDALFSYDTTLVRREIEEFFDQYYALLQKSEEDAQNLLREMLLRIAELYCEVGETENAEKTLNTASALLEALKEDAPYRFPKGDRPESTWERFAGEYLEAIQRRLN